MTRILFLSAGLLLLCGCRSNYEAWTYNVEQQRDALKAAEYEKMQTEEYRDKVEQSQKNMLINKMNSNNIIYRRY